MATTRSMLLRVQKLEHVAVPPMLAQFGGQAGWEAFQSDAEAGMADGRYDRRDVSVVVVALRGWLKSSVRA